MTRSCSFILNEKTYHDTTQEGNMEILILFASGGHAWMMVEPDEDPEDEIAEWCQFHGINEDNVADFVVKEVVV